MRSEEHTSELQSQFRISYAVFHAGNYPDDTQGCILMGENKLKGMVVNSRIWLHRLMKRIQAAENQGEGIWITII